MLPTLILLAAPAAATEAAVAPFLAWGVEAGDAAVLSGQIAQELDFLGTYTSVHAMDVAPPGLDADCLASADCLAAIADAALTDQLVVGQVSGSPETYDVFAVLFDAGTGTIVRQHRFQIDASAVADELGGQVRYLVTGELAAAPTAPGDGGDFLDDEDDFDFAPAGTAEEPIEVPATALDLGDDFEALPPVARYDPEPNPEPRERSGERSERSGERSPTGRSERAGVDKPRADTAFSLTARGGYAHYQGLNFMSAGGELGFEALQPVRLNIGLAALFTPLTIEGTENQFGVPEVEWRSVMPLNLGAVYVFYTRSLTPYAGGDLTLTAYTSELDVAPGVRLRAGFDYMATEHFGVNVDASAGMWFGTRTEGTDIAVEIGSLGLAPSFSLGMLLAF